MITSIEQHPDAHLRARIFPLNKADPRPTGRYVVYWMHQARRRAYNFALQHAVYRAREHGCGVLVIEDICLEQRWIGRRHVAFALQGMRDNQQAFQRLSWLHYLPLIERRPGDLTIWLPKLLASAVEVVTEQVPCGIPTDINNQLTQVTEDLGLRLTAVDTNGFLPLELLSAPCTTARAFRNHLHRHAAAAWAAQPKPDPCQVQNNKLPSWELPAELLTLSAQEFLDDPSRLASLAT